MIHIGNCLHVMPTMDANSVEAVICDPPYGLGFMGKEWDHGVPGVEFWKEALRVAKPGAHIVAFGGTRTFHRLAVAIEDAGWEIRDTLMWVYGSGFPKSHNGPWGGTALKPAWEPIILARKPLIGTVAANVNAHGTGALNIDGCRVGTEGATKRGSQAEYPKNEDGTEDRSGSWARTGHQIVELDVGRWPANLLHDGSEEVVEVFPSTTSGQPMGTKAGGQGNAFGKYAGGIPVTGFGDSGSASRFFYCAKADREDRNDGCDGLPLMPSGMVSNTSGQHMTRRDGGAPGPAANNHPTVKPTDLMRWLCRLVTPPGGLILDPFTGSGSTGRAAIAEGMRFVGIELDPAYAAIAEARCKVVQPGLGF